jgi:hypothetical protein
MRTALVALLLSFSVTTSLTASAADRPTVVDLLDGTHVEGVVVEVVPGDHCTVVLPSGARRVVPWTSIARIALRGAAPLPSRVAVEERPPPPPPPSPAAQPVVVEPSPPLKPTRADAKEGGETVVVTVRARRTVQLQMSRDGRPWETACMSPCDVALPVDAAYRIVDGGKPQAGFRLQPDASGHVVVDVAIREPAVDALGILAVIVGTGLLYGALLASSDHSKDGGASPAVTVTGLLGLGGGTVMLATNRASITQHPATRRDEATRGGSTDLGSLVRRAPAAPLLTISF